MSATPWVLVPAPVIAEMVTGRPWGQDGESLLHRLATATEDAVPAELWPWCVRAAQVVSTSGTTVVLHVDDGSAEGVLTCSADGPLIAQVLAVPTGAHVRMLDVQDLGAETRRLLDRPAPRAATVLVVDDGRERMTAWKDDVLAVADDGSLESARRATWDDGVRTVLVDAVCGPLQS